MTRFPVVCPEDDLQYGSWKIPRGSAVSMTVSSLGMDPIKFPEPHEFKVERWLQSPEIVNELKRSSIPFGRGSRLCLGME